MQQINRYSFLILLIYTSFFYRNHPKHGGQSPKIPRRIGRIPNMDGKAWTGWERNRECEEILLCHRWAVGYRKVPTNAMQEIEDSDSPWFPSLSEYTEGICQFLLSFATRSWEPEETHQYRIENDVGIYGHGIWYINKFKCKK